MLITDNQLLSFIRCSIFAGLKRRMMPMFWFRQVADLSDDLARAAWWAVKLPYLGLWMAYGLAGLAAIFIIVGAYLSFAKKWTCGGRGDHDDDDELLN